MKSIVQRSREHYGVPEIGPMLMYAIRDGTSELYSDVEIVYSGHLSVHLKSVQRLETENKIFLFQSESLCRCLREIATDRPKLFQEFNRVLRIYIPDRVKCDSIFIKRVIIAYRLRYGEPNPEKPRQRSNWCRNLPKFGCLAHNNYSASIVLYNAFLLWKCPGEIFLPVRRPQDPNSPKRIPNDSITYIFFKLYIAPQSFI